LTRIEVLNGMKKTPSTSGPSCSSKSRPIEVDTRRTKPIAMASRYVKTVTGAARATSFLRKN
jgi:hypothetical protein